MEFIKGITVLNLHAPLKRDVIIYVADEAYPDISHLSELDIEDITESIAVLEKLVEEKNPAGQFEFGVDLCAVTSDWETSYCRDEIHDKGLNPVATADLIAYLKELYGFKNRFSDAAVLKAAIGNGFEMIKKEPQQYKKWPHGSYYEISMDGICINLNLSEEDLLTSVEEYLDQI